MACSEGLEKHFTPMSRRRARLVQTSPAGTCSPASWHIRVYNRSSRLSAKGGRRQVTNSLRPHRLHSISARAGWQAACLLSRTMTGSQCPSGQGVSATSDESVPHSRTVHSKCAYPCKRKQALSALPQLFQVVGLGRLQSNVHPALSIVLLNAGG